MLGGESLGYLRAERVIRRSLLAAWLSVAAIRSLANFFENEIVSCSARACRSFVCRFLIGTERFIIR